MVEAEITMIGIRGVTRVTSRMTRAAVMMRPLSSSASSPILFHDVTVVNGNGIIANKISFKLEKGDRVALTGSNQEGTDNCFVKNSLIIMPHILLGRDAIMNILRGELQPAGGHVNFLEGKNVVTLTPTVGKKDHALSVSDYLAQHSVSPDAVNEVSHLLFVVVGFKLKRFIGFEERLFRRSPPCTYTQHLNCLKYLPFEIAFTSIPNS